MKKIFTLTILPLLVILLIAGCDKKEKHYYPVKLADINDSWSIIDDEGNVVVREEYAAADSVSAIYKGVYWVRSGNKYQLYSIDSPKQPLSDIEYVGVTDFHSDRAVVARERQPLQIINTEGEVVATLARNIASRSPLLRVRIQKNQILRNGFHSNLCINRYYLNSPFGIGGQNTAHRINLPSHKKSKKK